MGAPGMISQLATILLPWCTLHTIKASFVSAGCMIQQASLVRSA